MEDSILGCAAPRDLVVAAGGAEFAGLGAHDWLILVEANAQIRVADWVARLRR